MKGNEKQTPNDNERKGSYQYFTAGEKGLKLNNPVPAFGIHKLRHPSSSEIGRIYG